MNKVILIGNLTKDIELQSTKTGKLVTQFSIGVRRDKEVSDFPNCVAWGKTAELLEKYCHKGSKIAVEGSLQTSSYEKNGEKRYKTIVYVSNVEFLDSKPQEHQFLEPVTPTIAEEPTFDENFGIDSEDLPF